MLFQKTNQKMTTHADDSFDPHCRESVSLQELQSALNTYDEQVDQDGVDDAETLEYAYDLIRMCSGIRFFPGLITLRVMCALCSLCARFSS